MFGLAVWGTVHTAPKLGQAAPTAPPGSRAYCIKYLTAYTRMRLLLASIATGQLWKYASIQQLSLLSRPQFLEFGGLKYITSPPAKELEGLSPR